MSEVTTEDWAKTQQKVFTRFMNVHLKKRGIQLGENDLLVGGLDDGVVLWNLLEIVSGKNLPKINTQPKLKIQQIENISKVFDFLHNEGITLIGIGAEDILDKNEKLILGLSWQLILTYQIKPQKEKAELAKKKRAELAKKKKEQLRAERRKAREERKKRRIKAQETLRRSKHTPSPAKTSEETVITTSPPTSPEVPVVDDPKIGVVAEKENKSTPPTSPEDPVVDKKEIEEAEALLQEDEVEEPESEEEEEEKEEEKVVEKSPQAEFVDWLNSVGVIVQNITTDFQDGKNLCKLVNLFDPSYISPSHITDNRIETASLGIQTAYKKLGIPPLLDAIDIVENPNTLVNMTYLSYFRGKYLQHLEELDPHPSVEVDTATDVGKGVGNSTVQSMKNPEDNHLDDEIERLKNELAKIKKEREASKLRMEIEIEKMAKENEENLMKIKLQDFKVESDLAEQQASEKEEHLRKLELEKLNKERQKSETPNQEDLLKEEEPENEAKEPKTEKGQKKKEGESEKQPDNKKEEREKKKAEKLQKKQALEAEEQQKKQALEAEKLQKKQAKEAEELQKMKELEEEQEKKKAEKLLKKQALEAEEQQKRQALEAEKLQKKKEEKLKKKQALEVEELLKKEKLEEEWKKKQRRREEKEETEEERKKRKLLKKEALEAEELERKKRNMEKLQKKKEMSEEERLRKKEKKQEVRQKMEMEKLQKMFEKEEQQRKAAEEKRRKRQEKMRKIEKKEQKKLEKLKMELELAQLQAKMQTDKTQKEDMAKIKEELKGLKKQIEADRLAREQLLKEKEIHDAEKEAENQFLETDLINAMDEVNCLKKQLSNEIKEKADVLEKMSGDNEALLIEIKKAVSVLEKANEEVKPEMEQFLEQLKMDQEKLNQDLKTEEKQRDLGLKILKNELEFAKIREKEKEKEAKLRHNQAKEKEIEKNKKKQRLKEEKEKKMIDKEQRKQVQKEMQKVLNTEINFLNKEILSKEQDMSKKIKQPEEVAILKEELTKMKLQLLESRRELEIASETLKNKDLIVKKAVIFKSKMEDQKIEKKKDKEKLNSVNNSMKEQVNEILKNVPENEKNHADTEVESLNKKLENIIREAEQKEKEREELIALYENIITSLQDLYDKKVSPENPESKHNLEKTPDNSSPEMDPLKSSVSSDAITPKKKSSRKQSSGNSSPKIDSLKSSASSDAITPKNKKSSRKKSSENTSGKNTPERIRKSSEISSEIKSPKSPKSPTQIPKRPKSEIPPEIKSTEKNSSSSKIEMPLGYVSPPPYSDEEPPAPAYLPPPPPSDEKDDDSLEEAKYKEELSKGDLLKKQREAEYKIMTDELEKTRNNIEDEKNKITKRLTKIKTKIQTAEEGQEKDMAFLQETKGKKDNQTKLERKTAKERIKNRTSLVARLTEEQDQLEYDLAKFEKESEKQLEKLITEVDKYKKQMDKAQEWYDRMVEKERIRKAKQEEKRKKRLQKIVKNFSFKKKLEVQRHSYSDIEKKEVNPNQIGLGNGDLGGIVTVSGSVSSLLLAGAVADNSVAEKVRKEVLKQEKENIREMKKKNIDNQKYETKTAKQIDKVGTKQTKINLNLGKTKVFFNRSQDTITDGPKTTSRITASKKVKKEKDVPPIKNNYLLLVLYEESCVKMEVTVNSIADLKTKISTKLKLDIDFRLEYFDTEFSEFVSLLNLKNLELKSKIKVNTIRHQKWQFNENLLSHPKWETKGTSLTPYRSLTLLNEGVVMDALAYDKVLDILKKCGAESYFGSIKQVLAIQNDALEKSFMFYTHSLLEKFKSSPQLFKKDTWRQQANAVERKWVHTQFQNYTKKFRKLAVDQEVPIVPFFQGTAKATAMKIAQTGFTTVATLDDGWYARGIYFTSSLKYATYYSRLANKGAEPYSYIMIAFTTPGNIYPVIEGPLDKGTLKGHPGVINPGYQSHYVCVCCPGSKKPGWPCDKGEKQFSDELVLFQDAQAVPKYLLVVENEAVKDPST